MNYDREEVVKGYEMPQEGIDIQAVLNLCRPYMAQLCKEEPECGWIMFTYKYLLSEYFPYNYALEISEDQKQASLFLIDMLNRLFVREREELPFDPCRHFLLLKKQENQYCKISREYKRFLDCIQEKGVYVFMRLSQVCTPYNTLGHIAGVHHVAMYMARQLVKKQVPVDLGLMSGAALMHDIGKFGCRPEEGKKVPYLHYYYTYQYCRANHLETIGDIASNHSTWDLELENLSAESLLLIYADFRVKSVYDEEHKEYIRFWNLKEAYDVILSKLDHVDEAKKKRYARVYAKLKDFEEYMVSLGCSVDLVSESIEEKKGNYPALMSSEEIIDIFKNLAICSNLKIMSTTIWEEQFISFLEKIRSEREWRHVRAYLTAIEEYSSYLPQNQKSIILEFLFDMLSHKDGDIRRQAAGIAGILIADYEISFIKEIPEGYTAPKVGKCMDKIFRKFLGRLLRPEIYTAEQELRYAGFAMKRVLATLLERLSGEKRKTVLEIYSGACHIRSKRLTTFFLMDGCSEIAYKLCTRIQAERMADFAVSLLDGTNGEESQVAALRFILLWMRQGWVPAVNMFDVIEDSIPVPEEKPCCIQFLVTEIRKFYDIPIQREDEGYDMSRLYLENQRYEIPWIFKSVNMDILKERQSEYKNQEQFYQYASHLLHMLQFSGSIINRLQAGDNLLSVVPLLSRAQHHEVVLELIRALEIGEYSVSKYIPPFLGKIFVMTGGEERQYILEQLARLCSNIHQNSVIAALETAGKILHYGSGQLTDYERSVTEGILCIGMADYREEISQETFYVIGHELFGDNGLPLEEKQIYFSEMARKILTLMNWEFSEMYGYFNGAALNKIYRFIGDYITAYGKLPLAEKKMPVAFFPGTFDPFSLGHKQIVQKIRERGFRVYLSVDEFSWSKKPQPFEVRRKILSMSTADLPEVYLLPEEIPINIANPADMQMLSQVFSGKKLYIVVGYDVVKNASAYKKEAEQYSVHYFSHIVFFRNDDKDSLELQDEKEFCETRIFGDMIFMQLPLFVEKVSSTRIRENISAGRDILGLVESVVQNYIYDKGLYTMEPIYKKSASFKEIDTVFRKNEDGTKTLILLEKNQKFAWVDFHDSNTYGLLNECGSIHEADVLRRYLSGHCAVIAHIEGAAGRNDVERIICLKAALEYFQEKNYSFAIRRDNGENEELLRMHGFLRVEGLKDMFILDLRNPLILFYDTPSSIKESMEDNTAVRKVLRKCHFRLRKELTKLYPGRLILCFSSEVMNYRLIKLITEENGVSVVPDQNKIYGKKMCVPFGKILKGVRIPNTVTKDLDMEKLYTRDLSSFTISNFPGYAPLSVQLRTVRSFMRPVILVDDLYHSGHRMKEIAKHLEQEGLKDTQLIVAVMSGRGQDIARVSGINVRSVYQVPNMSSWLIESDLYPFIGGDGVMEREGNAGMTVAIPSINTILPYEIPSFLKGASMDAIYDISQICLENARDIYKVLEMEFRKKFGRVLSLERIGEVMAEPRYPDSIAIDSKKLSKRPSELLEEELEKLRRLKALSGIRSQI